MKRTDYFLLTVFFFIAACSSTPQKTNLSEGDTKLKNELTPLIGNFNVNRYSFKNGLKLLIVEDHSSPTFAYQTWFNVGSRDEALGKTGLAHLFEHMMFKGTSTLKEGEFDKLLEHAGAEGENAFTSRDYTAYIQELPKDKLELIVKLESDRMVNLLVNSDSFKTEREVVQNERRLRTENSPDGLMEQELFELAFTDHSYHWPVIGYQKDLDSMSDQDARTFYQAHYSPNHATLIVTGDVDPTQVRSLVEKYYGDLQSQDVPHQPIVHDTDQKHNKRKELKLNIQVDKLMIGYRIPEVTHEDLAAIDVLQNLLTEGKSSRLNRALVETGISSSVDAYGSENKDPTLFVISTNLQKGRKAHEAELVITKELSRLARQIVSAAELERAKNKMNFRFYEELSSNFERAQFLGHYETMTGNFQYGITHKKKIQAVTPLDIKKAAKKYLNSINSTVIVGVAK